jgi:diguanylate cyclase (GGDEF)-like protein/PAS domain S-box-containing protein
MEIKLHRLLQKQLLRELGVDKVPEKMKKFIQAVNSAYFEFENDRGLLERSIDISSREYNEKNAELKKAEERLANLVETIPQGIMIIDCQGKIDFANSVAERIFGLPRKNLIGRKYNDPLWRMQTANGISPTAKELPLGLVMEKQGSIIGVEYAIISTTGTKRILNINAAPFHDEEGDIIGIVVSLEDITLRKQMEEQLKYMGLHDSLTGLYNRTFFEEQMCRLSSGNFNSVGIIICDIDGLKLVNDTLGHERGDKLLLSAADIIKSSLRHNDVVARIGGDEFAILVTGCTKADLENICHKLKNKINHYNAQDFEKVPLSISTGFAVNNERYVNMTDLFKEADNNMYREKLHHQQSIRSTIVQTLVKAMEARDFRTEVHAGRMQDLMEKFAVLLGVSGEKIADLRLLAQFYDIGKVGIPDRILFKTSLLTLDEKIEMRRHCEIGNRIARSATDLQLIADWILKHHECWNGQGYPLGLRGEDIPLECRMMAIVDAYDAMTSDRPYRMAMTHEEALTELMNCAGEQFDPELVGKFRQLFTNQ